MNQVKDRISRIIDSLGPELFSVSRFLFENPETAYEEHQACQWLSHFLKERGFEVETGVGGVETSFLARPAGVDQSGPVAALLAEYDALPKIGHGCGHNLIAAASMGAALALRKLDHQLPGSFVLCGTPAEEGGGGKARLADGGVFKGIDFSLLFHPGHMNLTGDNTLGRIKAKVEFFGRTAHAATAPEMGLNALDALIGAFNNINAFRQQMAAEGRIHGIITQGGDAPNIIPDYTAALFYVRAASRAYLQDLFDRFTDCCQGAARAAGCRCKIEIMPPSLDPVKRNMTMEKVCQDNMEYLGLTVGRRDLPSGSTDLGNLSQIMPALQVRLGICDDDIPIHSVGFAEATQSDRGRKALLDAAKILAMTVIDYLSSPEIQKRAAEEFLSGAA